MLKYDQLFGTSARNWEAANSQNQDIQRWPGHCLGGAVGLDLAQRADARPRLGDDPGRAEVALGRAGREPLQPPDRRLRQRDPPRPAPARFRLHATASSPASTRCSRPTSAANRQNLLGNLRAFPPRGTINEVWNHGIGKYIATYHAVPGKGERAVRLEVELHANSGSNLNGQDDKPRIVKYEYILVYGLDGKVDETNPYASDWISVGGEAMFAPLNILEARRNHVAGPQPDRHRGQRPGPRHGQRRRHAGSPVQPRPSAPLVPTRPAAAHSSPAAATPTASHHAALSSGSSVVEGTADFPPHPCSTPGSQSELNPINGVVPTRFVPGASPIGLLQNEAGLFRFALSNQPSPRRTAPRVDVTQSTQGPEHSWSPGSVRTTHFTQ